MASSALAARSRRGATERAQQSAGEPGLKLELADVYAMADYAVPDDLPSFQPYLRTKYRDLPQRAIADLNKAFTDIAKRHGYDARGPSPGEDEQP
jgi:hypothetical protein